MTSKVEWLVDDGLGRIWVEAVANRSKIQTLCGRTQKNHEIHQLADLVPPPRTETSTSGMEDKNFTAC